MSAATSASAAPWPPGRTRRRSGSVQCRAISSSRKRWFLWGCVIAGYTTKGPSPRPYAARSSASDGAVAPSVGSTPWGTTTTCCGIGSVRVDHRAADVVGRHGDDAGASHRMRNRPFEISPLARAEILGVGEVLQVVDREHDRSTADHGLVPPPWWTRSASAVRRRSQVCSARTRRGRLVPLMSATTVGYNAESSGWASTNEARVNSVGANRSACDSRPRSWRTRYCSDPPTSPGTHHSRLTATSNGAPGAADGRGTAWPSACVGSGGVMERAHGRRRACGRRRVPR